MKLKMSKKKKFKIGFILRHSRDEQFDAWGIHNMQQLVTCFFFVCLKKKERKDNHKHHLITNYTDARIHFTNKQILFFFRRNRKWEMVHICSVNENQYFVIHIHTFTCFNNNNDDDNYLWTNQCMMIQILFVNTNITIPFITSFQWLFGIKLPPTTMCVCVWVIYQMLLKFSIQRLSVFVVVCLFFVIDK